MLAAFGMVAGLQPATLMAQAPVPQTGTIWTGTIGTLPITACFESQYASEGVYYYNAHLIPLRLSSFDETAPGVLTEVAGFDKHDGSTWTIESRSDEQISGIWRNGTRSYPIRLSAVPASVGEYGSVCESAEFVEPLLDGGTISDERANFEGLEYTARRYLGPARLGEGEYQVTSFALDPVQPGDAKVNRALASALPDDKVDHAMGQCVGLSIPTGQLGYLTETLEPVHVSDRWLGIERAGSTFCGGAHPNHFWAYAVYDRESGEEVDPSTWFAPEALEFYEFLNREDWETKRPIAGLSEPLLAIVLGYWPAREDIEDCADAAASGTSWDIGLGKDGVVFMPQFAYVNFACSEPVTVSWDRLEPFLSDEGRAVRDSL